MASEYEVVAVDHIDGTGDHSEWKTIRFVFHNFSQLSMERNRSTKSNVVECHGLRWRFDIFPGGHAKSSKDEVFVSTVLACVSCSKTTEIKARWKTRVPSAGKRNEGRWCVFADYGDEGISRYFGSFDFAKRSDVLDASKNYLVGGHLTVEIDIQVMLEKPPTWTPTNTISSDMLKLLDSADAGNADVTFEVTSGDEKELLNAHSLILTARCTALSELAKGTEPGAPIPIDGVHPDVFRMLLRFVYGGEVPSDNILEVQAKAIVDAANKYGCAGLKLTAEAKLSSAGITTDNAAELILFADGTNCAMLKEAAMDYFVKNAQDVMASDGFEQVKESPAVMAELMSAMAGGSKKRPAPANSDDDARDYKRMRVATLRQKLDEKASMLMGPRRCSYLALKRPRMTSSKSSRQWPAFLVLVGLAPRIRGCILPAVYVCQKQEQQS